MWSINQHTHLCLYTSCDQRFKGHCHFCRGHPWVTNSPTGRPLKRGLVTLNPLYVCVCVCVSCSSSFRGSPGPPFAEIRIRKSRPPGNPEGPRNYPLARYYLGWPLSGGPHSLLKRSVCNSKGFLRGFRFSIRARLDTLRFRSGELGSDFVARFSLFRIF